MPAKNKPSRNPEPETPRSVIQAVTIGGIFLLIAVVLHGIFLLWSQRQTVPQASVAPAATPYFKAELDQLEITLNVNAAQGWQRAPLYVYQGDAITLTPRGTWKNKHDEVTAAGSGYVCGVTMPLDTCVEPAPDVPTGALIARVSGQVFHIGAGGMFIAEHSGFLELRMNDGDTGLHDNSGFLTVEIFVEHP
jgi:hypothetical protein